MKNSSIQDKDPIHSYLRSFLIARENFDKVSAESKNASMPKHGRRKRTHDH